MKWEKLKDINQFKGKTLNPAKTPMSTYELYSVPNYDVNYPEIVLGKEIGSSKQLVQKNDVLLCKINPRINRVWIVEEHTENELLASSEWIVIRPKNVLPRFLAWYMRTEKFKAQMNSQLTGVGGSLTRAQPKLVSEYLIPVMEVDKQKQIVSVLEKSQDLINLRKRQIELLDELTKSLFFDMFGDPISNPKKWSIEKVSEVCEQILGGGTPSKSKPEYFTGTIPWVTPKDMKRKIISDSIDHINSEAISNSSAKLIPKSSLLMVIRSGILKRHLPVAINEVELTINQDMKAFIVKKEKVAISYFQYFWIASEKFILSKVRAVTADNIEFKQIKEMSIPVPPIEMQNEFAYRVKKIERQKQLMQQSLVEMEINFNSLMQRAFKGELFN